MQENLIQSNQISRIIAGYINIPSFSIPATNSNVNIYSTLNSLVSTSGYKNRALELRKSNDETENGVICSTPSNIVLVNTSSGNRKIYINRAEVYGKITYVNSTTYTISFYYLTSAGTESIYTFNNTTLVTLKIPYRYFLHQLPSDTIINLKALQKGEIEEAVSSAIETASDTWKNSVISIVNNPASLSPGMGASYLVGNSPIGIFTAYPNQIATFNGATWSYLQPSDGYTIKINHIDTVLCQY